MITELKETRNTDVRSQSNDDNLPLIFTRVWKGVMNLFINEQTKPGYVDKMLLW